MAHATSRGFPGGNETLQATAACAGLRSVLELTARRSNGHVQWCRASDSILVRKNKACSGARSSLLVSYEVSLCVGRYQDFRGRRQSATCTDDGSVLAVKQSGALSVAIPDSVEWVKEEIVLVVGRALAARNDETGSDWETC